MGESSSISSSSSVSGGRSVTLKIGRIQEYIEGSTQGYKLRVEVTEAVGLEEEIFVFQRFSLNQGNTNDVFSNIASPADLEEYPIDEPEDDSPFFRLSVVELVYRSLSLLESNLEDLRNDICSLLESLSQMDDLTSEVVVIDDNCATAATDPCPPTPSITARLIGATRSPTADDDAEAGYGNGSVWTNLSTRTTYVLISNTNQNALWIVLIGSDVQHNFTATGDPTVNDDLTAGYAAGSHWYNTDDDNLWICIDVTTGAAVWKQIGLNVKHNFTAAAAPTVNDDAGDGYARSSEWYDVPNDDLYICTDATVGAADWILLSEGTPRSAGDGLGLSGNALYVVEGNDSVAATAGGVKAATPYVGDKGLTPNATGAGLDYQDTGITITETPGGDGFVTVVIGIQQRLCNGDRTAGDCYFSNDAGATARAITAITAGDALYWNGAYSGVDLDANDIVDLNYNVVQ